VRVTIKIPDDLDRLVKAKSSLEGRTIREVTEELYRRWLAEGPTPAAAPAQPSGQWLRDWIALADETMRSAPPDPTARDLLEQDRKRLERG
jgi:transposase